MFVEAGPVGADSVGDRDRSGRIDTADPCVKDGDGDRRVQLAARNGGPAGAGSGRVSDQVQVGGELGSRVRDNNVDVVWAADGSDEHRGPNGRGCCGPKVAGLGGLVSDRSEPLFVASAPKTVGRERLVKCCGEREVAHGGIRSVRDV